LTIHSFELAGTLGRGQFGHVHLARHITSNYICALKALPKASCTSSTDTQQFGRELAVHQNLAHAHILRLLSWFHDAHTIYLVLEYAAGGCLFALLNAQPQRRFNERIAAGYVAQIAQALRYMHTKNVAHRDLKPENVLLGLHGEIKLADFGYSVHSVSGLRRTLVGTLEYLSPEVAGIMMRGGKGVYAAMAVDRWCLGVLVFELVVGRAPFAREGEQARERVKKIARWDGKGLVFPGFVSGEAEGLIRELLNKNAENRMSLDDVLEHPWI
ncbi:kinase-like protein, partial [Pyrenochaeta sp. DS3sAY3a]